MITDARGTTLRAPRLRDSVNHDHTAVKPNTTTDQEPTEASEQNETTDTRPWQDKEVLERLYVVERLTTREIADALDCTNETISRWLRNHAIPTRENWVDGVEAARKVNRREWVKLRTLESGYEYWASKEGEDRTSRIVYVHRLLAVAEYGYDAVCGAQVHHDIPIPWANWHGNIELLDAAEHGQLHSREYWDSQGGAQ